MPATGGGAHGQPARCLECWQPCHLGTTPMRRALSCSENRSGGGRDGEVIGARRRYRSPRDVNPSNSLPVSRVWTLGCDASEPRISGPI